MDYMEMRSVPWENEPTGLWDNESTVSTVPQEPEITENVNNTDASMEYENGMTYLIEPLQEALVSEQVEPIEEENDSIFSRNIDEGIAAEMDIGPEVDIATEMEIDIELPQDSLLIRSPSVPVDRNIPISSTEEDDILLDHVLLPRVFSLNTPEELLKAESNIISQMIRIADDWASKWLSRKTADLLRMLESLHIGCSTQTVCDNINNLRPGDSFAMFVRAQHCGILIHLPVGRNSDEVIVATFPAFLESNEIYNRDSGIEVKKI